jgi:hypothetical protein
MRIERANGKYFPMLDDDGPPKERASKVAERKWRNNALRRRVIEAKNRPKPRDVNDEPEIAETITNDGRVDGQVNRFESRFKREIRAMMEGYADRNMQFYVAMIEHRRYKLLKEKLRRLKAQEASGG